MQYLTALADVLHACRWIIVFTGSVAAVIVLVDMAAALRHTAEHADHLAVENQRLRALLHADDTTGGAA
ncbi:hypothetical protein K8Z61_11000 [Nocardioides sp. TRM66260-LWL]|uniref:hypothetical protein n=1 Tax=Nocardioides sp. TRM66260-LWL TaxID=2874478 RepID=UPI001CC39D1B|nr:hypothetical protein [Nocardioides sp. TRM66260-LWL]MBZ5735026.1 hypothetical protein [Nocardioides sp. TRM66260-LWL]